MVISMPRPARRRISSWLRLQDVEDAAADGADAQQADLDGFHVEWSLSVVFEEAGDAADRLAQVVFVRQEHDAEMVWASGQLKPVPCTSITRVSCSSSRKNWRSSVIG